VSRNADEFGDRYRTLLAQYESARSELMRQRSRFISDDPALPEGSEGNLSADLLEAHARAYFVDGLLDALGWTMKLGPEPLGRLLVEQPNRRAAGGTVKFMDYLGIEGETDQPLLILETKRPGSKLPLLDGKPPIYGTATAYSSILAEGLADPSRLDAEWNRWIVQVTDYVRSVQERARQWPPRVAITNGDWMVVFATPANAFAGTGLVDAGCILVLPQLNAVDHAALLIFRSLAFTGLVREIGPLSPAELPFRIVATEVDRVVYGLRVNVGVKRGKYKIEPTIYVQPIIFLRTRTGAWFKVHELAEEHEVEVPHDPHALSSHLAEVERAAHSLLDAVNHYLDARLSPVSLEDHYSDADAFRELRGFSCRSESEFEIVTGTRTHYLLEQPRVTACRFHQWTESCGNGQAATEAPILKQSTSPKSFFCSGEDHHCTHRATLTAKSQPLDAGIAARHGPRSGEEGQAFCELYRLDNHLCCQACNFHDVCSRSNVFRLPCH
jgi:hypothetical protein